MIENKETKFCPSPSEAPTLTAINGILYLYGGLSDRIWNHLYSYNFGTKIKIINFIKRNSKMKNNTRLRQYSLIWPLQPHFIINVPLINPSLWLNEIR